MGARREAMRATGATIAILALGSMAACAPAVGRPRFSVPSPGWTSAGAMDHGSIYLTQEAGVFAYARANGRARVVAETPGSIQELASDEDALYWFADEQIMRVAKAGGAPLAIVPDQLAHADPIVVDATQVYWAAWGRGDTNGMSLWAASKTGGSPPRRLADLGRIDSGEVRELAVDEGKVYVGLKAPGEAVLLVPTAGGAPAPLDAVTTGYGIVDGFAFDAERVYWVDNERKQVRARPKRGGEIVELASIGYFANSITLDGDFVYWGDWGQDGQGGSVQRVAKKGGWKKTLVSVPEQVAWVGVDAGVLYWFGPEVVQAVELR